MDNCSPWWWCNTTANHSGSPTLLVTHKNRGFLEREHQRLFPQMTSRGSVLVSAGRPSTVVPTARVVQPSCLIHFLPFTPKSELGPVRLLLGTCAPLQVPASHAWRAVSQREEILFSCLRSSGPRLLPPCCVCCWQVCTQVETGFHLSATFVIGLIGYEPLD